MEKNIKYSISEAKAQQWIKEDRGSGEGGNYKPWITVRDIPSEGRSHRVFGHKTQRTHHLLSDLELDVFFNARMEYGDHGYKRAIPAPSRGNNGIGHRGRHRPPFC